MDHYLCEENVYNRLKEEFYKYKTIIIAYDFDDTVFDFHKRGLLYTDVMELLREWKGYAKFICFTGCMPEKYAFIEQYLHDNDIPLDSINENVMSMPFNGTKVYYNAFLDDRAGLKEVYNILKKLIKDIKQEAINENNTNVTM